MDKITPEQRSLNMARVKSRNTALEIQIRSLVHKLGYRFRLHRKDLPGTPDLIFPKRRSAVFINGCFWHGHNCSKAKLPASNRIFWEAKIKKNVERDTRVVVQLAEKGWRVLTIWQCQTKDMNALQERLTIFLEGAEIKSTIRQ
jgi:DNA mismatch endonuclease (patch repair protein)